MIEYVVNVLAKQQYSKIPSNISYVNLYVKYDGSVANTVQLIDCEDALWLNPQQLSGFEARAKAFIADKGYEIRLLTIVVTPVNEFIKKFVLTSNNLWVIDRYSGRLIIYDNQPGDFCGLKEDLDAVIYEITPKPTEKDKADTYYYSKFGEIYGYVTPVNTAMALINVIVFLVMSILGSTENAKFMYEHGVMFVPAIIHDKEFYRFFTCMFQHFGFEHLLSNMVVLMVIGDNVERAVGKIRYILIYIIGGLFGSLGSFFYALMYNKLSISAGASGAIFALIGGLLWVVICNNGKMENLTISKLCILIVYSLYSGLTAANVDNAAHLCGLMGGFLVAFCIYRGKFSRNNR